MIIINYFIVSLIIIIAIIVLQLGTALNLLSCWGSDEVNLWVINYFLLLILCQLVCIEYENLLR